MSTAICAMNAAATAISAARLSAASSSVSDTSLEGAARGAAKSVFRAMQAVRMSSQTHDTVEFELAVSGVRRVVAHAVDVQMGTVVRGWLRMMRSAEAYGTGSDDVLQTAQPDLHRRLLEALKLARSHAEGRRRDELREWRRQERAAATARAQFDAARRAKLAFAARTAREACELVVRRCVVAAIAGVVGEARRRDEASAAAAAARMAAVRRLNMNAARRRALAQAAT